MEKEKSGFFEKLKNGLFKSRNGFAANVEDVFKHKGKIDEDFYEELEEALILGDVGVNTAEDILDELTLKVKEQKVADRVECRDILVNMLKERMSVSDDAYDFLNSKSVIMVVGVNGVGKTTTVGKVANAVRRDGKKVIVAAADTFRAAANEQLTEWAKRASVEIVSSKEGTDPASVVFDAVSAGKARNADVLICDTAGRLHNKKNLMEELRKMNKVVDREWPDAKRETWVVLDATTGQNAIAQAREFNEVAPLSGIVLTKMDGTAKGGIAIAITGELGLPVKYIGVGEGMDDLERFNPEEFVDALFEKTESAEENE